MKQFRNGRKLPAGLLCSWIPFALCFAKPTGKPDGSGRSTSAGGEKQGGFTLAELLVGTAANLLVIAGLFSALGQGIIYSENARSLDFVTQLLDVEMDEIQVLGWTEINALDTSASFDPHAYFAQVPLRKYECIREVTNESAGLKKINLIVSWHDLRGLEHRRNSVTFLTENGVYSPGTTL